MTWQRFKKNKLAMLGLLLISMAFIISVLGSLIRPDPSPMANQMNLQLTTKAPGFTVCMLKVRKNSYAAKVNIVNRLFFGGVESEYIFVPIESYKFEGKEIVIQEYTGVPNFSGVEQRFSLADVIYPLAFEPKIAADQKGNLSFYLLNGEVKREKIETLKQKIVATNISTQTFFLGTDRFGRDLLSRLMSGTIISLSVGLISVIISLLLGIFLGSIAGYFRGRLDTFILWIINIVWSIPTLLLVIVITFAVGRGFWQIFLAIGLSMWVEVARLVRGQVLSIREKEFIEAGKSMGFSHFRILFRHVLPNLVGPIIVIAVSNFANGILMEAGLSFLGIGVQPPMSSWGSMIKEHYGYIIVDAAYLAILPGLAIFILVLAFNLVGNGLNDSIESNQ